MDVQLPDGTTVKGVPDGTSKADLATKLRANGRTVPDSWMAPSGSPSDRIPRDTPESMGLPPNAPSSAPAPEPSVMDRIKGLPGAALSMATAIPAGVAGNIAGAAETLTGGNYGTPVGAMQGHERAQKVSEALTYQPRTAGGQANVESAGKALQASGVAGINPAAVPMVPGAGRAGGKAAMKVRDAIAESPEADLVKRGAGKVAEAAAPDAERLNLVKKANDFGIEVPAHKMTDNTFLRMIGDTLDNIPLSLSPAKKNEAAFNGTLAKAVGVPEGAKRLTRGAFDQAMTKSGDGIGGIYEKAAIPLAPEVHAGIDEILTRMGKFDTTENARIVTNFANEIRDKAVDGTIPGEALRKWNTALGKKIRSTADGDLKTGLSDLQETMLDALRTNLPNEKTRAQLDVYRKQYAIGKQIESLVATAPEGNISPAKLMGVVTRNAEGKTRMARGQGGDLGDLADVAQMFMKGEKSSGSTERNMAYGLIGDAGRVARDAALYPVAATYNYLGPKVTRRMAAKSAPRDIPVSEIPE